MYWHMDTPNDVIRAVRAHLAALAPPGDPPNPLRSSFEGEPSTFGGAFPARTVRFSGGSGQHRQRLEIPEELRFRVRIYDIAVGDRAALSSAADGSGQAEDNIIAAYSPWITALAEDGEFRAQVMDWTISGFEVDVQDTFGRLFTDADGQNILLRLETEVRVLL